MLVRPGVDATDQPDAIRLNVADLPEAVEGRARGRGLPSHDGRLRRRESERCLGRRPLSHELYHTERRTRKSLVMIYRDSAGRNPRPKWTEALQTILKSIS